MWRKDRLRRHLQNKLTKLKKDDEMERKFRAQVYDRLLKVLEEIESGVPNSITEQNLSEKLGKHYVEHIKKLAPRKNYESDSGWLAAVSDLIVGLLDAHLVTRSNTPSIGDVLSDEDLSERELAFEERLDAKIDKDIKQLGQMKTMKAIGLGNRRTAAANEPSKQIGPPAD